jgi:hypothetical protein
VDADLDPRQFKISWQSNLQLFRLFGDIQQNPNAHQSHEQ